MVKICPECNGKKGKWQHTHNSLNPIHPHVFVLCSTCKGTGKIPIYETPEQYKNRTGKDWPDDALVWVLLDFYHRDKWFLKIYKDRICIDQLLIVADQPGKPPADYRPED